MPKQRFGLGRGIDALIPGTQPIADDRVLDTSLAVSALFEVPVDAVSPNAQQPRGAVEDDQELLELADSIQQYGLLQPLLVALEDEDEAGARYQLIAGERRWRAAQLAGLERVPVVIKEATPQQMLEMALVENLQRSDLNPLEEAAGYQALIEDYRLTQEEVAQRVGRNRATIANTIRLLQLPDEVREALVTMPKVFTEGHARAVLQITGDAERIHATKQIIARRESVRGAEELARRYNEASLRLTPDRHGGKERPQNYETRVLEEEFTRAVQMKVRLQRTTKGKGSLTLFFTNEEQLQLLYQWLVQQQRQQQGVDAVTSLLSANGFDLADLNNLTNGANGHAAHGAGGDDGADGE
ncbi:MAG TPA: ParB/RepB/Spo0J family partition protein [Ktedonobacterales bacterium]|jgi:ParB family chromosome partitioning protein